MRARIKVFVDSNVVVARLKSSTGAASALEQSDQVERVVTDLSRLEILEAVKRLGLDRKLAQDTLKLKFKVQSIESDLSVAVKKFEQYVNDVNDSHVVAGAAKSRTRFLITHNLKHFKPEKIKRDLGIIVMSPGQFLQYLRSLG